MDPMLRDSLSVIAVFTATYLGQRANFKRLHRIVRDAMRDHEYRCLYHQPRETTGDLPIK